MPDRTTIQASEAMTKQGADRTNEDREVPWNRVMRGLVQSLQKGKSFVWIWTLVAAALFAMSVSTIFTRGRPKGIDFNWSG